MSSHSADAVVGTRKRIAGMHAPSVVNRARERYDFPGTEQSPPVRSRRRRRQAMGVSGDVVAKFTMLARSAVADAPDDVAFSGGARTRVDRAARSGRN